VGKKGEADGGGYAFPRRWGRSPTWGAGEKRKSGKHSRFLIHLKKRPQNPKFQGWTAVTRSREYKGKIAHRQGNVRQLEKRKKSKTRSSSAAKDEDKKPKTIETTPRGQLRRQEGTSTRKRGCYKKEALKFTRGVKVKPSSAKAERSRKAHRAGHQTSSAPAKKKKGETQKEDRKKDRFGEEGRGRFCIARGTALIEGAKTKSGKKKNPEDMGHKPKRDSKQRSGRTGRDSRSGQKVCFIPTAAKGREKRKEVRGK